MFRKYLAIACLIVAVVDFLYMFVGRQLSLSLYFIDIILFICAPITSFIMPKGTAKTITITLSFLFLLAFAGCTYWLIVSFNHFGP